MKTPKVRLYIRIRRPDGSTAYAEPVWTKNRQLRGGYATVNAKAEFHPEGVYYLRFQRAGKPRQWLSVGSEADVAIAALRNTTHDLEAMSLGRKVESLTTEPAVARETSRATSLEDAADVYLKEVRTFRSAKTIAACEHMLERFCRHFGEGKTVQVISGQTYSTTWPHSSGNDSAIEPCLIT